MVVLIQTHGYCIDFLFQIFGTVVSYIVTTIHAIYVNPCESSKYKEHISEVVVSEQT